MPRRPRGLVRGAFAAQAVLLVAHSGIAWSRSRRCKASRARARLSCVALLGTAGPGDRMPSDDESAQLLAGTATGLAAPPAVSRSVIPVPGSASPDHDQAGVTGSQPMDTQLHHRPGNAYCARDSTASPANRPAAGFSHRGDSFGLARHRC